MRTQLDVGVSTSDYAGPAFGVSNRNGEAMGGEAGRSLARTPAADLVALADIRRRAARRRAVFSAALLPSLALLSWLAWDSAPPREWIRPVGPTIAGAPATSSGAGLELAWGG